VVPTPEMIIKPQHSFVDPSGRVHSSYVRNWTAPRCVARAARVDWVW